MPVLRSRIPEVLVAIHAFLFVCAGRGAETDGDNEKELPLEMRFEPGWRSEGDCGPLPLYALMRLNGRAISYDQVRRAVPYDSKTGCSMKDLALAGESLGFVSEIRFLKPSELRQLSGPFILYANGSLEHKIGHFAVVVDHDEQGFRVINTDHGTLETWPDQAVLREYGGYVLMASGATGRRWQFVAIAGLSLVAVVALDGAWTAARPREKGTDGQPDR